MKFGVILALGLATGATANPYVLRYTESEPLSLFLSRYGLVRVSTVYQRPIHLVRDPLGRPPQQVIDRIEDDTDDDVAIEADQVVELPVRAFVSNQVSGINSLRSLLTRTASRSFYGGSAIEGFLNQSALLASRAIPSWAQHGPGTGVVAVIDTGVDGTHDFFGGRVLAGVDFLDRSGTGSELEGLPPDIMAIINPTTTPLLIRELAYTSPGLAPSFEPHLVNDPAFNRIPFALGHGTMVAGAVRMVAPGAFILPIRAFNQDGTGRLYDLIRSIHISEVRGAKVANLSFNLRVYSRELDRTCQEVSDRGMILVASSGNDGLITEASYPAGLPKVTGVASVNYRGVRSSFSNAGPNLVFVAAAGEAVLLPYPGQRWAGGWGTSFASPQVAGLAAKLLHRKPTATYSDLQSALSRSRLLPDSNLGYGHLDVFSSVQGF